MLEGLKSMPNVYSKLSVNINYYYFVLSGSLDRNSCYRLAALHYMLFFGEYILIWGRVRSN